MKKMKGSRFAIILFLTITTLFANQAQVESFVERFYQNVLNRHSEVEGLNYWTDSLIKGERAGADIARGFIFSQEFNNRNTSNEEYLNILYKAFFNREPDEGGYNYWLVKLNNGEHREDILDGFLYSTEFFNLSKEYGINPIDAVPINITENNTLPTTYSANDGRLLASSCFQCHGTNGVSTNGWDSLSANEMDEMIGEHPLMDAIGVGYTQDEIVKMTQWLSTMPNSGDNEEGDENENDGDKNKDEGDDDD